jgi:hypothetical protein
MLYNRGENALRPSFKITLLSFLYDKLEFHLSFPGHALATGHGSRPLFILLAKNLFSKKR